MRRVRGLTVGSEIGRVGKPNEAAESMMNCHKVSSLLVALIRSSSLRGHWNHLCHKN